MDFIKKIDIKIYIPKDTKKPYWTYKDVIVESLIFEKEESPNDWNKLVYSPKFSVEMNKEDSSFGMSLKI